MDTEKLFAFSPVSATRGHANKLYKPQCANAVRKNFLTKRVVNVWNSLPNDVDLVLSVEGSIPAFPGHDTVGLFLIISDHLWRVNYLEI